MFFTKIESGTASSQLTNSLRNLYLSQMNVLSPLTTPAPPSPLDTVTHGGHQEPSVVWEGPVITYSVRDPYGQTLTAGRANLTRRKQTGPSMLQLSSERLISQRQYMLARVTVYISIGRWTKRLILRRGEDMQPGSLHFLITTGFTSTLCALKICRRYSEHREHTTAKTG
jgi:hypothetical protein